MIRKLAAALAALAITFALAASGHTVAAAPVKVQHQHVAPVKVRLADWWLKRGPIHTP